MILYYALYSLVLPSGHQHAVGRCISAFSLLIPVHIDKDFTFPLFLQYVHSHCQPYIHKYCGVTEGMEEELYGCNETLLYIRMISCVEVKSCFGVLFTARALIGNNGIFVGRFGEEMLLLSRIRHIDHKLYKPTLNLW